MTPPALARSAAVLLVALAGCGKAEPTRPPADTPAAATGDGTPGPAAGAAASGVPLAPPVPGPALLKPNDPAQDAATRFVADLRAAAENPAPFPPAVLGAVSPAFLKVIGKPLLSPADKARGYSADAAEAWLRRAGGQLAPVGLPTGYGSPAAAVVVGSFGTGGGRFLLRMVQAGDGWKVDWFGLGTAKAGGAKPTTDDGPYQEFAAQAFLDALTGAAGPPDDRMLLLGAVLAPKRRLIWAEPFGGDKDRGYDFSPSLLAKVAAPHAGTTAYTTTPAGADQFKVELTKDGKATAYTLKLVKGTAPGEWLVDEFTPQ